MSKPIITILNIEQMDCPTEERLIRNKLNQHKDKISELDFNIVQRTLRVQHDKTLLKEQLVKEIESLGFGAIPLEEGQESGKVATPIKVPYFRFILAGLLALSAELLSFFIQDREWVSAILALSGIALVGIPTYRKGWIALLNRDLNINALMSIAVTGAFLIGQWAESAMVLVLFAIAELIEAKSLDRARQAVRELLSLSPEKATVQTPDGEWREVKSSEVPVGTLVRVRPGERVALDGEIREGVSSLDESPLTGESLPVDKGVGETVFAGTINTVGSFVYATTKRATESTLARIIHAVESAQTKRARTQRLVDRFSRIYTPVVFTLALLVGVGIPLWLGAGDSTIWFAWIYKALVLLVIACPCALVISTPVTIVSALTASAKRGILIKGGVYLEKGWNLKYLALDKTGTLTAGKPSLTNFRTWGDFSEERVVSLVYALSSHSDHPISRAIAGGLQDKNPSNQTVTDFKAILGQGTSGVIDGETYLLGNRRLIETQGLFSLELESQISLWEQEGKTVVALMNQSQVLGLFGVADTVKENSRQAVRELQALGIQTTMLTGDNFYTAQTIGAQVGINTIKDSLLPEDKLGEVEKLSQLGVVGMVGDGINDAPALARADIGFAMGAMGTDTAIETADVAIMDDDLSKIGDFVRLSRRTFWILMQNISFAIGIKAIFMILAFTGWATLWMAVFADLGVSLLVVANALRLLRFK